MIFSPQWFTRHQKILLWFANSWIGRRILCINGQRSSVGKNKIIKILPNSITWKTGKKYHTEFRTHDKFGKRLFYAFKPFWYLCHLWDMTWYPRFNLGFDTLTKYPDAHPETSTVDGRVRNDITGSSWATVVGASEGTSAEDTLAESSNSACRAGDFDGGRFIIDRSIYLFDTSGISGGKVSAAIFSLFVGSVVDEDNDAQGYVGLYTATPASNTALVVGDFDQIGSTAQATSLDLSSMTGSQYNNWTLNATGISNVSSTGITKFGIREGHDVENSQVASSAINTMNAAYADQTGTDQDPKLVVTYTLPMGGYIFISS